MNPDARSLYNRSFSEEKYRRFLAEIEDMYNHKPHFRIGETPVFVDYDLKRKIIQACDEITSTIMRPDFKELTKGAIQPGYEVPAETNKSLFLQYDFGICEVDGELEPMLIEAQGFPTLYFYQDLVAKQYKKHFNLPEGYSHLFGGLDSESYRDLLRKVIVADHRPENVVLLEVEPETQTTQIDYWSTAEHLGVKVLCVSDLKKSGRDLFYLDDEGNSVPVHRIYNRVIFDELVGRKDLQREFQFNDEVDVEWAGHPNWFFRISKYSLPLFHSKYVPRTYYLDQVDKIPDDLENYVLKPLYSFSGSGVIFHVTPAHFEAIRDRSNFILQEKVVYSPVIQAPDGKVKCEIRMLMIWPPDEERPILVNNLARLSRGDMIGVKYNKDKTWVGGSVGFFRE